LPSATKAVESKSGGAANLLRGSDLPRTMRELKVKVDQVREGPENFNSPLIMDLEDSPIEGKDSIPLNITNTKALIELLGDDYSQWAGATVTFAKILTNNPQTRQNTWGLRVTDARRGRPTKKKAAKKAAVKEAADNDVPF